MSLIILDEEPVINLDSKAIGFKCMMWNDKTEVFWLLEEPAFNIYKNNTCYWKGLIRGSVHVVQPKAKNLTELNKRIFKHFAK